MIVVNDTLLASYAGPGPCEWCGLVVAQRDPHHVFYRGLGGGGRIDLDFNLASLCRVCHDRHHAGKSPKRQDLLEVVARREGTTYTWIRDEINRLRREPKDGLLVVPRDAAEVRRAADLLAWALGGSTTGECSAVSAALAALQWALGEGSFGRDVLAPLLKIRARPSA